MPRTTWTRRGSSVESLKSKASNRSAGDAAAASDARLLGTAPPDGGMTPAKPEPRLARMGSSLSRLAYFGSGKKKAAAANDGGGKKKPGPKPKTGPMLSVRTGG